MTSNCVSLQYAGINIGPVHKKDVMKASTMLEHDPQYVALIGRVSGAMLLTASTAAPLFTLCVCAGTQ